MSDGLTVLGIGMAGLGALMILWAAFKDSIFWGLVCLFIPFVSLLFVVTHWSETKTGFLLHLLGWVVLGIGAAMAPKLPAERALLQLASIVWA